MKLSKETIELLKNFSTINSGIEFRKGNVLSTISQQKTILASTTIKEEFPQDFCVYDLNEFLSVYGLFKNDAELKFHNNIVMIDTDKNKVKFREAAKNAIVTPPEGKKLSLSNVDVSFSLSQENILSVIDASRILKLPHISIESDGHKIYLKACDASNDSAHESSIEICEGNGLKYKFVYLTDNWKVISGSYDIEIDKRGISLFKNTKVDLSYFIVAESKFSNFTGE